MPTQKMTHDIVVAGASAGGVEALMELVAALPAGLPVSLFVVLHIPSNSPSMLAQILGRVGNLSVTTAADGEPIERGHIYVASPDFHLLLTRETIRVTHGPRENRHRPAIDPLFRTAALAFGPRVVGIVLSGMLNDGTAGLIAIKQRGGVTIAQEPATATFASMPLSACAKVDIDWCLPPEEIAKKIIHLSHVRVSTPEGAFPVSEEMEMETKIAGLDPTILEQDRRPGVLTGYTCPECKGPLWAIQDGEFLRFRCRVGHAFTAEAMAEGQVENAENALWSALNTIEESPQLYEQLAAQAKQRGQGRLSQELACKAEAFHERAHEIRELLAPIQSLGTIGDEENPSGIPELPYPDTPEQRAEGEVAGG